MIYIVDRDGDATLADAGLDVRRLLWRREERFVVVQWVDSAVEVLFAADAAQAASMLLTLIGSGVPASEFGRMPAPVEEIIRDHASGLH